MISAEEFRRLKGERHRPALIAACRPLRIAILRLRPSASLPVRESSVTGWLLDTNIFSELRRPKPEHKALSSLRAAARIPLYQRGNAGEIRFGIERPPNRAPRRAQRMAGSQSETDVRAARPPRHRRHHVQVAAAGRRGPQGRPYIFQPDLINRSDRSPSRPNDRFARHERLRKKRARPCSIPGALENDCKF